MHFFLQNEEDNRRLSVMEFFVFFAIELFLLYFLSRRLMKLLHLHTAKATKNRTFAVYVLAILFLPGTLFHELAHYISAIFLGVPVGAVHLWPKIQGNEVTLGSVEIAKTDPIRRFLIGIAPFLVGIATIIALIHFGKDTQFVSEVAKTAILGFAIFEIANSMFASDKDMEGSLALLLTLGILLITFFVIGVRFSVSFTFPPQLIAFLQTAVFYLLFPVMIDAIFVLLLSMRLKKRFLSL